MPLSIISLRRATSRRLEGNMAVGVVKFFNHTPVSAALNRRAMLPTISARTVRPEKHKRKAFARSEARAL